MEYVIRPIEVKDAPGINLLRRMPGTFENILGIPSERMKRNEDYLKNLDPNVHQFVAVAEVDGEEIVVGTAGLMVASNHRLRHSASIGMMVHQAYQGMGIGNALMATLLDIADNWLMLVRVELDVFTDNTPAISLYKKHGFVIEGTRKAAAIRNGAYVDDYIMARIRGV
ncbi:MAG: L-phenylalanine/L-methionine N-acetyltransferase [Clostridiales bacterium]|jgi:putative acetyltransferase|nr:L-phenylalanine/L-methionine N-acetyltransferase [Clostridiales bacterium]MDN5297662.1 L-phenylalanine/L-methionine N-acetyltransferase [Clostridiales bacterium]